MSPHFWFSWPPLFLADAPCSPTFPIQNYSLSISQRLIINLLLLLCRYCCFYWALSFYCCGHYCCFMKDTFYLSPLQSLWFGPGMNPESSYIYKLNFRRLRYFLMQNKQTKVNMMVNTRYWARTNQERLSAHFQAFKRHSTYATWRIFSPQAWFLISKIQKHLSCSKHFKLGNNSYWSFFFFFLSIFIWNSETIYFWSIFFNSKLFLVSSFFFMLVYRRTCPCLPMDE